MSLGGGGRDLGNAGAGGVGTGICGMPGGGRNVKPPVKPPGLNSGAETLSGLLPNEGIRVCKVGESLGVLTGEEEATGAPNTNGLAKGLRSRLPNEDCWLWWVSGYTNWSDGVRECACAGSCAEYGAEPLRE